MRRTAPLQRLALPDYSSTGKNLKAKAHVCPPSNATHPRDRWETAFVYAFIQKFTNWRSKVEGFESINDLEEAIISPTQHYVLVQILTRLILLLKPATRNLSPDQLPSTLSSLMQEHMKGPERTCFWDEKLQQNLDPLQGIEGGFWAADWDVKLKILRMLVELALVNNTEIHDTIDRAWGIVHNKHKKKEGQAVPSPALDPRSKENLSVLPVGQDANRKRYWALDDSPRLYMSSNPWKVTCEFRTVADTKEEYDTLVERLATDNKGKATQALVDCLRVRRERIDTELMRVQKVRRKLEQKEILRAQAEMRVTRTRRQTRRPDYVYTEDFEDDDEGEDYTYQDEMDEEHMEGDDNITGKRRSQRTAARNANGKRASDAYGEWRGERRSSRLAADYDADEGDRKRARTEERSTSSAPSETLLQPTEETNGNSAKENGAAAVKEHEVAMEQVPGKKKSKFWFYAVEPIAETKSNQLPTNQSAGDTDLSNKEDGFQSNGRMEEAVIGLNGVHHVDRADTPSALFSLEEKA